MPLTGRQASLEFAEQIVSDSWVSDSSTDSFAIPINELCQELIVTEIGHQYSALTGTSVDIDLFQSDLLQHDLDDPAMSDRTNIMDPGASYNLAAAGTAIYRPPGGILVTSDYKDDVNSPARQIIQIQLVATHNSITLFSGSLWIKYFVKSP